MIGWAGAARGPLARRPPFIPAVLAVALAAAVVPAPAHAVKLGVLTDLSGVVSDATGKGSVVAAELAAEDAGGALLGKPIEIVSADHQIKPDIASSILRKWFDLEGVDAVADLVVSPIAIAAQQIGKTKNKIVLISGAGTQALFGSGCTPTSFVWMFDTRLQTEIAARAATTPGAKWFLISPSYSYGIEMEELMRRAIAETGGKVVGAVRLPLGTNDFSSAVSSALSTGPDYIGFAQAGHDGITLVQQAHEFGAQQAGVKMVAEFLFLTDVHSLGQSVVQGMYNAETFYWDANDATRAFSKRFEARMGRPPSALQAGVYSSALHYFKAVKQAGSTDSAAVANAMRAMPVNDATIQNGRIRADGRLMRDMYLVQVKAPSESSSPWDLYRIVSHIPAEDAQSAAPSPDCKLP